MLFCPKIHLFLFPFLLAVCGSGLLTGQESPIVPLINEGHRFGETEIEKDAFPKIEQALKRLENEGHFLKNDTLIGFINGIVDKVKPPEIEDFSIKSYLLKSPEINAGIYMNGALQINTGLLAVLDNEAQLAYIICHELAHFIYRHSLLKYCKADELEEKYHNQVFKTRKKFQESLVEISEYSILIESEADSLGLELFLKAGYSPQQAVAALEKLPYPDTIGYLPTIFKTMFGLGLTLPTHPKNEDRIAFLNRAIEGAGTGGFTGDEKYGPIKLDMALLNIAILKSNDESFGLVAVLDSVQHLIPDTTSIYYREIKITKAEVYQRILDEPILSGQLLYIREQKTEHGKVPLLVSEKTALTTFEKYQPAIEKEAIEILHSILDDPDIGYRALRALGMIHYQNKDYKKAENYLTQYLQSGKKIPDKRFINHIIDNMKK